MTMFSLSCGFVLCLSTHPCLSQDDVDDAELLVMLRGIHFKEAKALIQLGPKAFPAYVRLLQAERTDWLRRMRILSILAAVKADRSQFVEFALDHLTHSHAGVRHSAVRLLGEIGNLRDAAPVVALLSDQDWTVGIAAAKTLVVIGDQRTLQAMDVWIANSAPRKDRNESFDRGFRNDIAGYRDELKQRLDKVKAQRPPQAPPPRPLVKR